MYLSAVIYVSSFMFMIEYILRQIAAPSKYNKIKPFNARIKYIFSFYGLVDLVAALPFILIRRYMGTDAMLLMVLPFILITFKLLRHSTSFIFICDVLKSVKSELLTAYTLPTGIISSTFISLANEKKDGKWTSDDEENL